jgi:hypothetical protein
MAFSSTLILLVADFFEPFDVFAVQGFLHGDVGHGCGRGRAVPMLLAGRAGDDVASADLDLLFAPALRPADAIGDYQTLAERMDVPGRASPGANVTFPAPTRAGSVCWNRGSIVTSPVNVSGEPLIGACDPLRLSSIGFLLG